MSSINDMQNRTGWQVSQVIAAELDLALTIVYGYFKETGLHAEGLTLVQSCPADWLEEGRLYIEKPGRIFSLLEIAADLAGVRFEENYQRAVLAMRSLSLDEALAALSGQAQELDVQVDESLAPALRFQKLGAQTTAALFRCFGYEENAVQNMAVVAHEEYRRLANLLRGQNLHERFWMWLDRFFYEVYQPWRAERAQELAEKEARVAAVLGAKSAQDTPPNLDWLPAQNPLRVHDVLGEAVRAGRLRVVFWVDPFGLYDTWALYPGQVMVSFSEPGALLENFRQSVESTARRAAALADPTRLIILRMIRHFGLSNTEMARLLGVARPTVSVHARILREAGLIETVAEGRTARHYIRPEAVRSLFADLELLLDLPDSDPPEK